MHYRLNLQSWLPLAEQREINNLLVGFGQTMCKPIGPKCNLCELSAKGLCPSARTDIKESPSKAKKVKKVDTDAGVGVGPGEESGYADARSGLTGGAEIEMALEEMDEK